MGDGITSVEECPDLYQFQKPQQANVVGPVATTLGTIGLLANTWTTSSFFPRDAMHTRPMPSCGVRLSVRLFVRLSRSYFLSK